MKRINWLLFVGTSLIVLLFPIVTMTKVSVEAQLNNLGEITNPTVVENRQNEIYVQAFAPNGGNGSMDNPYKDFKQAYSSAKPNDTIVLLDSVPIQSDDNNLDSGVFTFNKPITITSKNGALSSRVPIQLEANVCVKDMELAVKNEIYLNGYTLNMINVKNFKTVTTIPTVYGGSYQKNKGSGAQSVLSVRGIVSDPFVFDTIYAGAKIDESNIPVAVDLSSGVKVENGVNAGGTNGKVNAPVNMNIGNVNINKFENSFSTVDTSVIFNNYHNTNGPILKGFSNVSMINSNITAINKESFSDVTGLLKLDTLSTLNISNFSDIYNVGAFSGEQGSKLIINKRGRLNVEKELSGFVEMRTPGVAIDTSGLVEKDHIYISADVVSDGTVTFLPFFTQTNLILNEEIDHNKNWIIRSKKINNPITTLEIVGSNQVKIEKDSEQIINLSYSAEGGQSLDYIPMFEYVLKGSDGKEIDINEVEVVMGDTPEQALVYISDDKIQPGNYTLDVVEKISGKTFSLSLNFVKEILTYTIEFNSNGGEGTMPDQMMKLDQLTKINPNTFTKAGYMFKGWSLSPTGQVVYSDEEQVSNLTSIAGGKIILYAVWVKKDGLQLIAPETIDFGMHKLSATTKYYGVKRGEETQLRIIDNRGIGNAWSLTARLQSELVNDSGKALFNALVYKENNVERVINSTSSQIIVTKTTTENGEITNLSDNWNDNEGLLLKITKGSASVGNYTGIVEWVLNDTP